MVSLKRKVEELGVFVMVLCDLVFNDYWEDNIWLKDNFSYHSVLHITNADSSELFTNAD